MSDLLNPETPDGGTPPTPPTDGGTPPTPPPAPPAGDRPAWLPENFKQPEDLVKSYNELRGKLRDKLEAPEAYTLPENLGYEPPEGLLTALKSANVTQAQAEAVLAALDQTLIPALAEQTKQAELKALAAEWQVPPTEQSFKDRQARISAWAKANLPPEVVSALASSSKGVLALERMMQSSAKGGQTTPVGGDGAVSVTMADVNKWVADSRYGVDLDYTRWVEEQVAAATKNGPLR